jgi:hypothetical protein
MIRMKNKIKYWMGSIGILGVLLGRILNRVLSNYFGDNASNLVVAVSVAIVLCMILLLIAMAHYIAAIELLVMVIPLIISGIGLYLNNMDLVGLGILSVFIIYPILIKVIPKLKRNK